MPHDTLMKSSRWRISPAEYDHYWTQKRSAAVSRGDQPIGPDHAEPKMESVARQEWVERLPAAVRSALLTSLLNGLSWGGVVWFFSGGRLDFALVAAAAQSPFMIRSHLRHEKALAKHAVLQKVGLAERVRADEESRRQREAERAEEERRFRENLRRAEYFRTMDPIAFEHLTAHVYKHQGHEVEVSPASGDGGVDVRIRKNGRTRLVQCKRVKSSVGRPVVQQLFGAMVDEDAAGCILVTTGKASQQARDFARGKPIEIVELPELMEMAERAYPDGAVPGSFTLPEQAVRARKNRKKWKGLTRRRRRRD